MDDDLPDGFDVVLVCDVSTFNDVLCRKVRDLLNPGGRLILVDKFSPDTTTAVPDRIAWAFQGTMENPSDRYERVTVEHARNLLLNLKYEKVTVSPLPSSDNLRWNSGWTVMEARK